MGNRLTYAFVFALLLSTAVAGQVWKLPTFGPIEARAVFFDGKMAIGSQDGTVYYVYSASGSPFAKNSVGGSVEQLEFGNGMVVAATDSDVVILDKQGNLFRDVNLSTLYGIDAGDFIYASAHEGLKAITYDGNLAWVIPEQGEGPLTAPREKNGLVLYGAGDKLVVANASDGTEIARIGAGGFWKSRPELNGRTAYIGSTDGNLYAIDIVSGKVLWNFDTGAWIMSDPLYSSGNVYVGSNNGNLYALDASSGRLIWKRKTGDAIEGGMEMAQIGGRQLLLFGSNDNRMYAVSPSDGSVSLAFSTGGWVHNPALDSGMLFFGSYDGSYYAYLPDRACSIDSPLPGQVVGYKQFNLSGRVFSTNAGAAVNMRVNNMSWQPVHVSGNDWFLEMDPNDYPAGQLYIECRVSDNAGSESQGFTYLVLLRDTNAQKGVMGVDAPRSATQGKAFTVRAYDENGKPLQDFRVMLNGKTFLGDNGTASVNSSATGQYDLVVKKVGYEDYTVPVGVGFDLITLGTMAAVALAVIGTAFYLFVYKRRR